jgi:hypothetical protein
MLSLILLFFVLVQLRCLYELHVAWRSIKKTCDYCGSIHFVAEYQWHNLEKALAQSVYPNITSTSLVWYYAAIL